MGRAQRVLDSLRRVPPRKKKSQIAPALRPGSDGIVHRGGDRQSGDSWNRTGGLFPGDAFQNPPLWTGKHHRAGGNSFAGRIPAGEFQRVTNEKLFEPDWVTWRVKKKSQGPSAEPAD